MNDVSSLYTVDGDPNSSVIEIKVLKFYSNYQRDKAEFCDDFLQSPISGYHLSLERFLLHGGLCFKLVLNHLNLMASIPAIKSTNLNMVILRPPITCITVYMFLPDINQKKI